MPITVPFKPQIFGKINEVTFGSSLPSGATLNVTGSTTISYTSGRLRAVGGSASSTNNTENILLPGTFSGNDWEQCLIFKPISTGLGLSLIWASSSGSVTSTYRIRFNYATGVLTFENDAGVIQTATAISYTINQDVIYIKSRRNKLKDNITIECGIFNVTSVPSSLSFSTVSSQVQSTVISFHSGTVELYKSWVRNFTPKSAKVLTATDSNGFGVGCTLYTDGMFYLAKGDTMDQIGMTGGPSASIEDLQTEQANLIQGKPYSVYMMIGTNNRTETNAVFFPKAQAYIDAFINAGIKVRIISVLPTAGNANIPNFNASYAALDNGNTIIYIDINTALNDGAGSLAAPYNSGDNLHINTAGNLLAYGLILPQLTKDLSI